MAHYGLNATELDLNSTDGRKKEAKGMSVSLCLLDA